MSEKDWEEFEDEGMWWMKGRPKWTLLRLGDAIVGQEDAISLTYYDHHGVQDPTLQYIHRPQLRILKRNKPTI